MSLAVFLREWQVFGIALFSFIFLGGCLVHWYRRRKEVYLQRMIAIVAKASDGPRAGAVLISFRTYFGIAGYFETVEHRYWAKPDVARLILHDLHGLNRRWGLAVFPLIPLFSWMQYAKQRALIDRQENELPMMHNILGLMD